MLQAFEGIIDASGLRSFRQDGGRWLVSAHCGPDQVPFWAVLDTRSATQVLQELSIGNRRRALVLLEATAVSLGSRLDGPNGARHQ